ncbi:MAG: prefoldin subunit alpha [Acidilobaceae archaeon]|nr:prefoldin subunit alpha [Acidilobaceae archaeon]MCX8165520.1 prefoldin subunit alpha [Acidilobaceae archaeon]MDW7973947.1 prefoldin subunit alpha [Sulfolobales archaeon]
MSGPQKHKVDVGAVAAQAQLIKEQIDVLQLYSQQLLQMRDSVLRAMGGIEALKVEKKEMLIYLDPHLNVAGRFQATDEKIMVLLGLNVYAKLTADEALKVLEERKSKLERAIDETRKRMDELAALYDRYQAVLQAAVSERR